MKKNKKGKKKNKMAGRSRPGRDQSPEAEETKVPIAVSDTSETEDQADGAADSQQTSRDTEGLACDSGIDSGRGSPGEDSGLIPATGDGRSGADAGAAADEAGDKAARKSDASTKTDTSPRADAKLSPKADRRQPAKAESKVSPKVVDNRLSPRVADTRVSPKLENKPNLSASRSDSKAQSRTEGKLQPKAEDRAGTGTGAGAAAATPTGAGTSRTANRPGGAESSSGSGWTDGAVSMKPDEPLENIKHPLEFPWEFWVIRQDVPWEEALTPCASFDSVEDFWYYFNVLKNPRVVQKPILMFKKGIRPEWEDYRNQNGGRWNLVQGLQNRNAEEVWQELALMMIGGLNFGPLTPHLNGIYCAWKADGLHYSVWIDTVDEPISSTIGNTIHKCLRSILNRSFHMELVNTRAKGKKRSLLTIK